MRIDTPRIFSRSLPSLAVAATLLACLVGASPAAAVGLQRLEPTFAEPGETVALVGSGFDPAESYELRVDGVAATIDSVLPDRVTFTVPGGASSGPVELESEDGSVVRTRRTLTVLRTIAVTVDPSPAGHTVGTAYGDAGPASETVLARVKKGEADLVIAYGADDAPAYMGIAVDGETQLTLDSASTAAALVFLHPGVRTADPATAGTRLTAIAGTAPTQLLADRIDAAFQSGIDYLDDPELAARMLDVLRAVTLDQVAGSVAGSGPAGPSPAPLATAPATGVVGLSADPGGGDAVSAPASGAGSFRDDRASEAREFGAGSPHPMPHFSRDYPRKHTQARRAQPDAVMPGADGVPSRRVEFEPTPDFVGPYNPLDWITVYYEIDPFQTTSGGRLVFERGNRSVYNLRNDGRYFERLDDAPVGFAIVRQRIAGADELDVVNLIADRLFGELPGQDAGIPFPVDRSGLYIARSFSGAVWPDQFDLLAEMPDGYAQYAQAAALNVFLVGVDYAGLVLKAEDIVGEEAFNQMIFGVFLATQKSIARASAEGEFDRTLLLTLAKDVGVGLAKGALGAVENAVTGEGFFRKAGKVAIKTIDLIGKLGTAVQAEARWSSLTNDDGSFFTGPGFFGWPDKLAASVESTAIVIGDPWAPQVTGFEPAMAYRGDTITIRGKRFSQVPALNIVEFGEIADDPDAEPTVAAGIVLQATPTSLLVQVPTGIDNVTRDVSIGVRVQKLGGTTTDRIEAAGSFKILGDPVLDAVDPTMPAAGGWARVSGTNFSPIRTYNRLETRIGAGGFQPALDARVDGNVFHFRVPDTDQTVGVRLALTDENLAVRRTSNTVQFTPEVLAPPPSPSGAVIRITSTADNLAADDTITLREALLWSSGSAFRAPTEDEGILITGGTFGAADADAVNTGGLAAGAVIQLDPALGPLPALGDEDQLFSLGVIVDGGGMTADGLQLVGTRETLVTNFTFRNFDGRCILLSDALGNRLDALAAESCTGDGIVIEGDSRSNWLSNIAASDNDGHGIRLEGAGVQGNTFSYSYGVAESSAREIADNGGYGMLVTGAARENRLQPGHIRRNALGGILLEGEDVGRNTIGTLDRTFGPFAFMEVADNGGHGIRSSSSETYVRFVRIIGNQGDGIRLDGSGHTGSRIASCQIGFDFDEQAAGNTGSGIHLLDSVSNVFIGDNYTIGFNVGPPNVIGDNGEHGIFLDGPQVHHIRVNNSRIGASIEQRTVAGNARHGIAVLGGSHDNTLGDLNEALHLEIVSHVTGAGIYLAGTGTTGNVVVGNAIGVLFRDPFDYDAGAIYGNRDGIRITDGAWGNLVGQRGGHIQRTINGVQVRYFAGNLIYASLDAGVVIESGGDPSQQLLPGQPVVPVGGNVVQNNFIGTTNQGGPNRIGVLLRGEAKANRIGGEPGAESNSFRGNREIGIHVDGLVFDDPAHGNRVVGNTFEFQVTQTPPADPFLERSDGIAILVTDSQGVILGGDSPTEGNVLQRNMVGVQIENSTGVQVRHNRIGNRFGTSTTQLLRGNRVAGAILINSQDCEIGPGNEVLANGHMFPSGGIGIFGGQNNRVFGNSIGASYDGLRLANEPWGVLVRASSGNVIGGPGPGSANAIVATRGDGVLIDGGATGNRIVNNSIGRRTGAPANEANTMAGVRIAGASTGNVVGGEIRRIENGALVTTPGGNTIHANGQQGVVVTGAGTTGNSVLGNSITGHPGIGIDNVAGGNAELPPPTITDATDGFVQGFVDPSIPAGSVVEVFSDLDDEGEALAGQARTDAAGFFRAPRQSTFADRLHATVTHSVSGDTSELGPEYVLSPRLDVRRADGVNTAVDARAGDRSVVLLALRVETHELAGEISALRIEAAGTLHDPSGIAGLSVVEDRDGDGALGNGDAVLGSAPGFDDDDGTVEIPLRRGILNAGDVRRWLVTVDLGSSATRGTDLSLRIAAVTSVDARSPYTRSALPVSGLFPIDGDPVTIDQAGDIGTRLRIRVSSDTADGPDFTSIQHAIDAAGAPSTTIEILPGLTGVYSENLHIATDIRLVLDGDGVVTVNGGSGTAIDVAAGNQASVLLRGLTLSGADGLLAAGPVELEDVRFDPIVGTAVELTAAHHTVRGMVVAPGAQRGVVLAEGASLLLERGEIRQTAGNALSVDGNAWVASTLVADCETGAVLGASGSLELVHGTFAGSRGVAVDATSGGFVSIERSILWGNGGGDLTGTDCGAVTGSDTESPDCSDDPDSGNLSVNPAFVGDGDFRLDPASPLIDQGAAPASFTGVPCLDLDGNPRAVDRNADGIAESDPGAYEALDSSRTPAEIGTLIWTVDDRLTWPAAAGIAEYHVYRGSLGSLAYDGSGTCVDDLDADRTDTEFDDFESPLPGEGWFYLITADQLQEGSSGLGSCSERSRLDACP